MHQVLREQDAKVTTDGAGGGVARIGGTHHVADNFPGIFGALEHQGDNWSTGHKGHQFAIKALANVLFVVAGKRVGIELTQFQGHNSEAFGFESGQNGSDETAFDGVGLEQDKGTVRHGR